MESRLQLGVRAHDIGKLNVHELAHKIAQAGFTSVHLALHKAIEGFLPEPGHLSHQIAHEVHAAFTAKNLSLGVLGCYINPVHPDPAIRATELERFLEHITFARSFGATVVGTETGSKDPSCGYHEDTRSESTYTLFYRSVEPNIEL
jgi:L-ribulose-5-phosphate 3-epimerase